MSYLENVCIYIQKFLTQFLNINQLVREIGVIKQKVHQYETQNIPNSLYPPVDDMLDYQWATYKFLNIIPPHKTTNQIEINIKHTGFYTDFSCIDSANHKILCKVIDPLHKASWETPWMDACNATTPFAMFPIDGTRCVYGIFSTTESRTCFIGHNTTSDAIFYIRVGIPIHLDIQCHGVSLKPVDKKKGF